MTKIRIGYRQIIDHKSTGEFEKNVFNDSFSEFYMQAQAYNPNRQYRTLGELIQHNSKANSIHYKVGFSIGLYIQELHNIIPVLRDTVGKHVRFEEHEFEILHSNVTDKSAHRISIVYITPLLNLFALSGGYAVVSETENFGKTSFTFTIPLQHDISIIAWENDNELHKKNEYESSI